MVDSLDALTAEFQNYIVAPINAFGLGGFLFDTPGESIAHLGAEITDHYTEDNRALQDHIAIKPKKITLKGYVGELVYSTAGQDQTILQQAVQKLTVLSSYLPTLSAAATQILDTAQTPLDSSLTLSDTANIYGLIQNLLGATGSEAKQQNAYTYFKALMTQGILMAVQTPWEFMTNMAIESVTAIQSEQSIYITDFSIVLKEIRIAQTISTAYTANPSPSASAPNSVDSLSPQANADALAQYRLQNNLATPPIDQQLQGAAALQAALPVPQGNVPGVGLPTNSLPGWQSTIQSASDIVSNPAALSVFTYATGGK